MNGKVSINIFEYRGRTYAVEAASCCQYRRMTDVVDVKIRNRVVGTDSSDTVRSSASST